MSLDKAGRALVPTATQKELDWVKRLCLLLTNDRIEIWDKSKYFNMIEENMTDFADLANEVMGDLDDREG